ncbi:uncharacterized protein LOC126844709 [Adelges cooleyi]|uniref:uncharacterized protein LOC126844709 n=1 Tax=Adelges cooleyi TaxID=133065 RepID=UPI00217FA201|nr:uncharacterized protein LOC126844709 [Adelges cooleyi]
MFLVAVSHKRGVTRWKESMTEKDTTLMRPFRNKHTYPVLDVCKNVSNAPRYYNGVFLGPFRSTDVKMEDDYAPLKPRTTYIFVAVIMYDNRKNLFPDHGLLINMDYDTVMGVFAFENEHIWNPVKHVAGSGNRNFHIWSNYVERPILHPDRNDDRRINVQHFSIVSYYLPWIYHVVKTDTIDLMVGDTDEEESTTMDSSTTDRSFEITTPITDLPDTYYDSDGAFYGVEFNVNPCGKAVGKAHRRLPSALCTAAMCCFTLCAPLLSALNWF